MWIHVEFQLIYCEASAIESTLRTFATFKHIFRRVVFDHQWVWDRVIVCFGQAYWIPIPRVLRLTENINIKFSKIEYEF